MTRPKKSVPKNEIQHMDTNEDELLLPIPYPEYLTCPHCGEPEVEIYCHEKGGTCHACGKWIDHEIPRNCKSVPVTNEKAD